MRSCSVLYLLQVLFPLSPLSSPSSVLHFSLPAYVHFFTCNIQDPIFTFCVSSYLPVHLFAFIILWNIPSPSSSFLSLFPLLSFSSFCAWNAGLHKVQAYIHSKCCVNSCNSKYCCCVYHASLSFFPFSDTCTGYREIFFCIPSTEHILCSIIRLSHEYPDTAIQVGQCILIVKFCQCILIYGKNYNNSLFYINIIQYCFFK